MANTKKIEELTTAVKSRLGNEFNVVIENGAMDGVAIIEYKVEDRYPRAMAYFPAVDGRKKLDPVLTDHIVFVATQKFLEQSKLAHYTERAKEDARSAYLAIVKATQGL